MERTTNLWIIFTAVSSGNEKLVRKLILKGTSFYCPDVEGQYPIHVAATNGHLGILKSLVQMKPDLVDITDNALRTPLICASLKGHLHCVMYLLKQKADIEHTDVSCLTPLLAAVLESHSTVAKLLISSGANIHVTDILSFTPLHHVVCYGDLQLLKQLLEIGVKVDVTDIDGWTPFYMASLYEKYAAMRLLISKGACVNIKDNKGYTPYACCFRQKSQDGEMVGK